MTGGTVAVILAGGSGTRFWPLQTNKLLFPFLGKTLIGTTVRDVLPRKLIARAAVIAGPDNIADLKKINFGVPADFYLQQKPTGMADAILTAKADLTGKSLLVIIADDLTGQTLYADVLTEAGHSHADAVMPGLQVKQYFPGGYLTVRDQQIISIVEKPGAGNEPSNFVNITGQYFRRSDELIEELEKTTSKSDDVYEVALNRLMSRKNFQLFPYDGVFTSLKYPWNVLDVMNILFTRISGSQGQNVQIRPNVIIEGDVVMGDNVKIFENTKIIGPCYIGNNTIIGNHNLIRESHIGDNCITGFGTEIARSYVGADCWFHSNYVGDSVLEGNVSLGSGTVLANLRLDESLIYSAVKTERISSNRNKLGAVIGTGVRIGVNTSVMPGVKIGSGSFIGAGMTVSADVADDSFLFWRDGRVVNQPNRQKFNPDTREKFRDKI